MNPIYVVKYNTTDTPEIDEFIYASDDDFEEHENKYDLWESEDHMILEGRFCVWGYTKKGYGSDNSEDGNSECDDKMDQNCVSSIFVEGHEDGYVDCYCPHVRN